MFHWRARNVLLLAAPLVSATKTQRFVRADVRVVEETSPSYALVFTVTLSAKTKAIERRVTKQLMARVFECAIAAPRGRVATLRTRHVDGREYDDAIDSAMRKWICGGTSRPPTREQLTKWLLSRMLVEATRDGWVMSVCGEDGEGDEEGDSDGGEDFHSQTEEWRVAEPVQEAERPMSPPPPPYSAGSGRSERALSNASDYPEFFSDSVTGDQADARDFDDGEQLSDVEDGEQIHGQRTSQERKLQKPHMHSSRSTRQQKPTTADLVEEREYDNDVLPVPSQYRFEPAAVRISSQRRHSHSGSLAPTLNAWTEERNHFHLELTQSKRDIEIARERQRKAEAIASLKKKHVIEQSQKKLLAHEQKLRDARFVKQSISDTLEYHEIAHRMESQRKQTQISATRDQERLSQSMRVALGRSGDQWHKGPVLGRGPLSQIEIDFLTRGDRTSPRSSMWIYDLHGRRHHESKAGAVAAESVFDSAMKKIQRLLDRKPTESVDLFRTYDLDNSGTLEYREFQHLLSENGVALSAEQTTTLFRHFDPNRSGAIDYGELLWGFFNRRAFLKRWRQRKTKLSAREIKLMFYKYDRVGRGALSPVDFQLALDDIGFRVSESEAKLLCLKFDMNKDGFIDYNEFHAFVNDDVDGGEGDEDVRARSTTQQSSPTNRAKSNRRSSSTIKVTRRNSTQSGRGESMIDTGSSSGDDMERILSELRALNETQDQIRRSIGTTH